MIPLFGAESFKIGFEYIPLMITYFLVLEAMLLGICSDVIGLILVPTSSFRIYIRTILLVLFPHLSESIYKNVSQKVVQYVVIELILVLGIGASLLYIYFK